MARAETAVLVGREDEFARLEAAAGDARQGRGACVLVTGEPGVGKSHLVATAAARWRGLGALVLDGACEPYASDELAYGPFVQAWSHLDAQDGVGFAALLVELAGFGELPADVARAWLFDRVARQLDTWGRRRPVVVVVEDVHWADRPTLALLRFLARAARQRPRLILATARSDGEDRLGAADELTDLVASGHIERLALTALSAEQTRALVRSVLDAATDETVVDTLVTRSGGNPYLAGELALAAAQGVDGLPSTLQRVLSRRISAHGEDAELALATVAVAADAPGEVLDAALAAVLPQGGAELVSELLRSALLVPRRDGDGVRLRHAVLGEVALRRLAPSRLRAVHHALAVAWGGDPAAARHWEQAGDLVRALRDWVAAGRADSRAGAYCTAAHAYSRVLDLAARTDPPRDIATPVLTVEAAEAMHRAGDDEGAVQAVRAALTSERPLTDAARLALLDQLQSCLFAAGHASEAFSVITEAAELADGLAPSRERTRIVAADGSRLMFQSNYADGAARSALAARWAQEMGAQDVLAYALGTQGVCRAASGHVEEGLAVLAEARRLAASSASVAVEARTAINQCYVLANAGRYAECVQVGREAIARLATRSLAHTLGAPLYYNVVIGLVALGHWDDALTLCEQAESAPVSATTVRFLALSRARVAVLRGLPDVADSALAVARHDRPRGQPAFDLEHAVVSVLLLRLQRRDREALALARDTIRSSPGGIDRLRLCAEALSALADLVTAGGRVRRVDDPHAVRDELLTAAGAGSSDWSDASPEAMTLRRVCVAEGDRVAGPSAQYWPEIADAWADLGLVHDCAYARLRLAEALVASRSGATPAAAALRSAYQAARRLGADPLLLKIAAVARRGRLPLPELEPVDGTSTGQSRRDPRLDALTRREREVLEYVGTGMTNRQIARRLGISERTAAVHVSNLIAKLGVGNRVEAARIERSGNV
jgi:DNA-binding CsgD family transcriptional regulator/tetratricopeptide (TPR) repeat protein